MLECQREQFSLPDDVHYLNGAYMSPLSRRVEAAGVAGVMRKRDPTRVRSDAFFVESDRARELFARLVGAAEPRRVAIVPSVSYGMAAAARNLPHRRGQNIVVAAEQFPSNVYVWRSLCEREGLHLRTVAAPDVATGRGEGWNARLLEAIDADTAIVALGNVHWVDGTRFDLARIGERARAVGASLVVDGTQSVGALPFDLEAIRPDVLVCATYKWLMGPYSVALAYYGERMDGGVPLEESWLGREGSEDLRSLATYTDRYQPGALRYDVGERSNFALMPMVVAALEQLLEWEPARIQQYCATLTAGFVAEAGSLGYRVEDAACRGAHLFGLVAPPQVDPDELLAHLESHRVFVSLRNGVLRVSPNVYNDADDLDALAAALREVG